MGYQRIEQMEKTIDFLEVLVSEETNPENVEFFTIKLFNCQKALHDFLEKE